MGKSGTVLWQFCLPLFGSVIFQQLYNIADSWVAGRFIGQNALAAVGNSYEITLIFIAFAFGCNMGCSVTVSGLFGARDYVRMKTAVYTAMITTGIVCLCLMVPGLLLGDALLLLIQTPAEVLADSKQYLDIYLWGLPFLFFYNLSTGIFSALGDSKTPFLFLAGSSLSNIVLDILFVTAFQMGVAGVAWATFLCQGISCVLAIVTVWVRLCKIETVGNVKRFDGQLLKKFASIAIPSTLQQSFISIGNIVIQGVINSFGTDVMAGYSGSIKLNNLVITSFTTIGNGISNYTAQNLGAGKPERIREGFRAGLRMVWMLSLPFAVGYFLFGETLIGFFLKEPTRAALSSGFAFLRIVAPFYFVVSAKLVADGILRGSGRMNQFMTATFTDLILRVVLAFGFSATALKSVGIWCAWPIAWTVATLMSLRYYKKAYREYCTHLSRRSHCGHHGTSAPGGEQDPL